MKLLDALRNSVQGLEADLANSSLFEHRGDRGEFREKIVENFLRPFLPKCYGLGSGAVFSEDGLGSRQIDVVVFDDVFSNVLFRSFNNSLYPCESVFGAIEVKSRLTSDELDIAIENVRSLKRLPRSASDMLDLLPFRRWNVGDGLTYDMTPRNPYLGLVFAFDGLSADSVVHALNNAVSSVGTEARLLPDFVFNYRGEYMVLRLRRSGNTLTPAAMGAEFDKFGAVHTGADTLPLFFLTINVCLNQLQLRGPDLNGYWNRMFREAVTRPVPTTT